MPMPLVFEHWHLENSTAELLVVATKLEDLLCIKSGTSSFLVDNKKKHTHACICIYACACICVHAYACLHMNACICISICMHACMRAWASLSWKSVAPEGKKRKQLIKNYTYVQARMHAEHPSAGSRLHLTEKCRKIQK